MYTSFKFRDKGTDFLGKRQKVQVESNEYKVESTKYRVSSIKILKNPQKSYESVVIFEKLVIRNWSILLVPQRSKVQEVIYCLYHFKNEVFCLTSNVFERSDLDSYRVEPQPFIHLILQPFNHSIKQSDHQTIKLSNYQTIVSSDHQIIKQSNHQIIKQSNHQ